MPDRRAKGREVFFDSINPNMTGAQVDRTVATIVDSIDDKLGEFNYDNTNIHRKALDTAFTLLRAPG